MGAAPAGQLAYSLLLRRELSARSLKYAQARGLPHCLSYGDAPVVAFEPHPQATRHGNFLAATYKAILANADWKKRLHKPHSQARTSLPPSQRGRWCELDSCNSSDALLMNVFCHPAAFRDGRLCSLLALERHTVPVFGFKARVPLQGGKFDRTEVDMRLGSLLVEAKLTETDFQSKSRTVVSGYRDFAEVFDRRALPQSKDLYFSYQLIRNVLAAHATGGSFCVIADSRRPDLIEAWYAVMRCVQLGDLRLRCKVLTWQELSQALPRPLQLFLDQKYGIAP